MKRHLALLAVPALPLLLAACSSGSPSAASPQATTLPTTAASSPDSSGASPVTSDPTTDPSPAGSTKAPKPSPTTGGSGGGSGGIPRCHTGGLSVKVGGGDGAAGSYSLNLVFTNKSGHTCTMYGFPGVSWVAGDDGHQVNTPFVRQGTKQHITLKPGGVAHSMLVLGHYQNLDPAKCKPVAIRGFRIYPPDETAAIFLSSPGTECSAPGFGRHDVHAMEAGPGPSAG